MLLRIVQRFDDTVNVFFFKQSSDRAGVDALAALHTVDVVEALVKDRRDLRVEAAVDKAQNAQTLNLLAGLDAASAQHALGRVADDPRRNLVKRRRCFLPFITHLADPQLLRQLLQLAVLVANAGKAIAAMVGQDQLDGVLTRFQSALGIGEDLHPLADWIHARSAQAFRAFDLNRTDAAGAGLVDVF